MSAAAPEPGLVAGRVYSILKSYNEVSNLGWVLPNGTRFRCFPSRPGRVEMPDTAFITFGRVPALVHTDDGHCQTVPDCVVEVVAPDDLADAHIDKVLAWLAAGARLVWELFPKTRSMYVTRPDGSGLRLEAGDTLTGEDVLPGFASPIAEFFRLPGEPAPPV